MTRNPAQSPVTAQAEPTVVPVVARDGARFELLLVAPDTPPRQLLYWLPALGVPARHYLPLATALAARGVAVALHEWRGIGSSDRRAGRRCDWAYRDLLESDMPAGVAAARGHWPRALCLIGGHSLGGQLSCLHASLHPDELTGIVLVASGAPYWRRFRRGALIGLAYVLAPWLARLCGHLPGRRIGFGGNEACGVIADWARSGRSGRYAATGMAVDFELRMAQLALPVLALRLRDDWLGPRASLAWLLGKMPRAAHTVAVIGRDDLAGQAADHFTWMKYPQSIATQIADWLDMKNAAFVDMTAPSP